MKHVPLLIEILTEELPAIPFLKEYPHIATKWSNIASKYHIHSEPILYFTPRRIVLYDEHFPIQTADQFIESYGPPTHIAFVDGDRQKGLSKAGLSFYNKLGLPIDSLHTTTQKDGKEVLYHSSTQKGQPTNEILASLLKEWLESLTFGKNMHWGECEEAFIRPVRNLLILLNSQSLELEAFGIQSKAQTFVHRDVSFEPQAIHSYEQYLQTLKEGKVILSQKERKERILNQIAIIESSHNIQVEIDEALLEEVVAITEYPQALFGEFDKAFLNLPNEVIITSMKTNQRYFATYRDSQLHNGFILVSNSTTTELNPIIYGNQKVLKARLSDAMFFYENDLKAGFQIQNLQRIIFVDGLGTLLDKSKREHTIALELLKSYAPLLNIPLDQAQEILSDAVKYAKADLITEMVYEFTELQGIMGYYYAKSFGMHPLVATAIKEQYLPTGEDSALPSNLISAILALSIKFDTLFSLFSINKIPTGSKDPFALRRASSGIIRIVEHFGLDFDIHTDLTRLYQAGGYKPNDLYKIQSFFIERLDGMLKINPSILRSALNAKVQNQPIQDLKTIIHNALALNEFIEKSDKTALTSLFKRVANIISEDCQEGEIVESLLSLPQEKALYEALNHIANQNFTDLTSHIDSLFSLKTPLEAFFQYVLVNDSNPAIKANRQRLILRIYNEFLRIGDLKEITL